VHDINSLHVQPSSFLDLVLLGYLSYLYAYPRDLTSKHVRQYNVYAICIFLLPCPPINTRLQFFLLLQSALSA
jgi:hypothetical protein